MLHNVKKRIKIFKLTITNNYWQNLCQIKHHIILYYYINKLELGKHVHRYK